MESFSKDLRSPFNNIDLRNELNIMEAEYSAIKSNVISFEKDYEKFFNNFSEEEETNKLNNNKFLEHLYVNINK